ncbi:Similar to Bx42: Puff-specific protein Bx42 (Drosophila melanogaster) [Cotesia congregata]|uniref:Similar to Bx42: Puff-specific protein Bx42 (Drosophila melanogaster) n=1 Tax=Cotesia congregata TaxID=51543 RepID=A0A8J2H922_COTCN|nr:Similar to Bx42: Puff-specific protein Bx42 (Drosophila melanogaster) [Cotesia congregata]
MLLRRFDEIREENLRHRPVSALVKALITAPPYGHRKGWIPQNVNDYGNGGAFPEIHVPQYPLEMGKKGKDTSNALAIQLDAEGRIKYDLIARQGHSKDKIVYSKLSDLLPSEIANENDLTLVRPSEEELEENTERTRKALEKITQSKIAAAMPVRCADKQGPAQYVRYTPSQQGQSFNSGAKQRVIRMVEAQVDPMEPPKFRINKKIPRGPPSPPAPVMHSPTRRVTVREQKEWKIPPCISNWKNAKGYTIPLDKRLAADGRGLQSVFVNENFAKLAEAFYIADRKATEAVELRAKLEKRLAQKEKEKKENHLRELAQKAREERAALKASAALEKSEEFEERNQLRHQRHQDRARDRNLARAAPDRRSRLQRERERDISEQIALGIPAKNIDANSDSQFDQRLFNTTKGIDTGYGPDDEYNVYEKPWKDSNTLASNIYRAPTNFDKDNYGEELEKIFKTSRFVPDKEFTGTDRSAQRTGPVQFEKDQEEEDPFGLDNFLRQAKRASTDEKDRRDDREKRRKY